MPLCIQLINSYNSRNHNLLKIFAAIFCLLLNYLTLSKIGATLTTAYILYICITQYKSARIISKVFITISCLITILISYSYDTVFKRLNPSSLTYYFENDKCDYIIKFRISDDLKIKTKALLFKFGASNTLDPKISSLSLSISDEYRILAFINQGGEEKHLFSTEVLNDTKGKLILAIGKNDIKIYCNENKLKIITKNYLQKLYNLGNFSIKTCHVNHYISSGNRQKLVYDASLEYTYKNKKILKSLYCTPILSLSWWEFHFHDRLNLYVNTLKMISDNLPFGVGLGCWHHAYYLYRKPGQIAAYWAHNDYIQFVAEVGLISILLIIVTYLIIRKQTKYYQINVNKETGIYIRHSIFLFLINMLFDFPVHVHSLALLIGLMIGLYFSVNNVQKVISPK